MKTSLAFFKQNVLPALVCFVLALFLAWKTDWKSNWLERLENITLDARTVLRAKYFPTQPRDDVVVVGIDQESLNRFGRWPWSRAVHGDFVQLAGVLKPSAITFDILFDDPSDGDARFAAGITRSKAAVVLAGEPGTAEAGLQPSDDKLKTIRLASLPHVEGDRLAISGDESLVVPLAPLGEVAEIAFATMPRSSDGVPREAPIVVRVGDQVYPSLALRSLMLHWHVTPDDVQVRLGDAVVIKNAFVNHRIPINAAGRYLINYRHALEGFNAAGYSESYDFIRAKYVEKKDVPVPDFTGRILLVGQTADGLSDFGPTPFSPHTPLMLVHANIMENVLNGDFARRATVWPIWLIGLTLTAGSLGYFARRPFWLQGVFSLGVPVIYIVAAWLVWAKVSVWVPIVWPVLGFTSAQIFMVARRVLAEQRAKEQVKGMFGTYVSPELVKRMVDSGVSPKLGGHEDEITAYFSDIQGFSGFSEMLQPEQLVELMNEYLTACTDIVQEEGGTLDKYIGDAVVVMFGAPIALPDHAYRACVTTQRVQLKLAELRTKWKEEGDKWPAIVQKMQSRIGLNSGRCIIGNMGSRTRFNYTMMGDNVNLAARMESGAKSWGVYTMCSEATKLACEEHGGDRLVFRPLGRIVVKGRTQPVPIFEIVGLKENVTTEMRECIGIFEQGLAKYHERDWDGAIEIFRRSATLEVNAPGRSPGVTSNPSLVYIDIATHCLTEPPPENWGGVYVMKEK